MKNEIYTATGCARCKITKNYLKDNGIPFEEFDFKGEGKDAFAHFYRTHRKRIFRDKDGVEFPVFHDGKQIRQGVSVIIGYLIAEGRLDGYISRSSLHGEWIDGFDISTGDPEQADGFLTVLKHLKGNGLKIEARCHGSNTQTLDSVLSRGLVDRLLMEVKGPAESYHRLTEKSPDKNELYKSIELATRFPEFKFFTTINPWQRTDGTIDFLTPEEIGAVAQMIKEASGSNKHPYLLKPFDPTASKEEQFKDLEPIPQPILFKYRTRARRHLPKTEVEN